MMMMMIYNPPLKDVPTSRKEKDMQRTSILPTIYEYYGNVEFFFQQDSAPPHYHQDK